MRERERRTGKPGVLQPIGPQRVGPDLAAEQQMFIGRAAKHLELRYFLHTENLCSCAGNNQSERKRDRARLDDIDQVPGFSCVCSQPPTCVSIVLNPELLSLEGY